MAGLASGCACPLDPDGELGPIVSARHVLVTLDWILQQLPQDVTQLTCFSFGEPQPDVRKLPIAMTSSIRIDTNSSAQHSAASQQAA